MKFYIPILIGLVFISFYLYKQRKKHRMREKLLKSVNESYSESAQNIVFNISKSQALYKSLITKVHPDKFSDEHKSQASELSAKLTEAKRNFKKLQELKVEVEGFLKTIS